MNWINRCCQHKRKGRKDYLSQQMLDRRDELGQEHEVRHEIQIQRKAEKGEGKRRLRSSKIFRSLGASLVPRAGGDQTCWWTGGAPLAEGEGRAADDLWGGSLASGHRALPQGSLILFSQPHTCPRAHHHTHLFFNKNSVTLFQWHVGPASWSLHVPSHYSKLKNTCTHFFFLILHKYYKTFFN
jgi:hypothetical protein